MTPRQNAASSDPIIVLHGIIGHIWALSHFMYLTDKYRLANRDELQRYEQVNPK